MSKPIPAINRYRADLRELHFLLFEQIKIEELLAQGHYDGWDADSIKSTLTEMYKWVREVTGPLNATAPNPVTNTEFTRILGAALGRPTMLRVPSVALLAALGPEMARETLLVSQRVRPARLEATGYEFHHPELPGALEAALGR